MVIHYLIYGAMGLLMEVGWTGLNSIIHREFKLIGTTSIWMFFIYGLAVFLEPLCQVLMQYPVLVRGGVYVVCIFAIEYATGGILKLLHICPWDYSRSRYSVRGLIRLDYAPVWFAAGLLFERVYQLMAR